MKWKTIRILKVHYHIKYSESTLSYSFLFIGSIESPFITCLWCFREEGWSEVHCSNKPIGLTIVRCFLFANWLVIGIIRENSASWTTVWKKLTYTSNVWNFSIYIFNNLKFINLYLEAFISFTFC